MVDVKNIKQVFVAKDCARTASVQIWDKNAAAYIGNGEMVITDAGGTVLNDSTALKAVDRIKITTRSLAGDDIYTSVEIPGNAITGLYTELYSAASEQVSYLGYNGATGAFDASLATETLYWIKVISKYNPSRRVIDTMGWTSSTVTPSDADIVLGLADAVNTKKGFDSTFKVKATVLQSESITSTTQNLYVTVGSKLATWSAGHSSTAGDVLSIKGAIYYVDTVISTTRIKLNMAYQGTVSEAVTAGTGASNVGNVPDKTAGSWGLKLEGLEYEFVAGLWNYNKCKFELAKSENIVTNFATTVADRGNGTYPQVADLEWHTKNFQGNDYKLDKKYPISYKYDAPLSTGGTAETFDLVTITWENRETKNIAGDNIQFGSVVLAIPVGASQGDGSTSAIKETLNKYIVTEYAVPGATAIVLT